ncbi:LOW QUALITY PROTEIN: glycerol-3-phosphate acyltransferase 2, mitochondrial [Xenentodon cancila]
MVQETNDGINNKMGFSILQNKPAMSLEFKIKKKVKVPYRLGLLRPFMGQCCHQCTPDSLRKTLGQKSWLGSRNLLNVNETHTRYRGWLVRKVCCALFVIGCKVYESPVGNRLERIYQSNRVRAAFTADLNVPEGVDGQRQLSPLSPFLPLFNTCISSGLLRFVGWLMLKMFASVFGSIEVNVNNVPALRKASEEGSLLVYVHLRQSYMDCALIPLVLFCHNLRVPYTVCPLPINSSFLRSVLQKVGVILLPPSALSEVEAEEDALFSPLMTSLVRELLHEGQAVCVGVSAESGQGGQWLLASDSSSKKDLSLMSAWFLWASHNQCATKTNLQASTQVGLRSVLRWLWSLFWKKPGGSVVIHFALPFSLKEMCDSGRCRVDEWLPLQDLLLPVILNNRAQSVYGKRQMLWLLPSHYVSELSLSEREPSVAIILHLIFSATSCMAVMSTSVMSSLLLYKHCKGVSVSVLCRDFAWLTEELVFKHRDVGFGGNLAEIVHYSLTLLAPHIIIAAVPTRKDPFIMPRPSLAATLHLSRQAQMVTHTFILEAVGACAVSAMLCEVVFSGVSSRVRAAGVEGEEVMGDMEFDVVLCQSELTERALQLCHLLPPGIMPPCQSSQSFALEAIDSLVQCGILIMEEIPRDHPISNVWKREGTLTWATGDLDPHHSDSESEEQDLSAYKISRPSRCPDLLFFLCRMLAGHLRALCWTTMALDVMDTPLAEAEFIAQIHSHLCDKASQKKRHYESCSEEAAHTAVRTLIDLGRFNKWQN